jgi:hypothetical protein
MNRRIMKKGVSLPIASTLLLNVGANLLGLHRYSYDAFTHTFFASHYMRDWLNLWETRWYGGFPVTGYPPLVHQLIAVVGWFVGIEVSYQIMCIVSAVMLVFSLYKASLIFVDRSEAKYVALVASLLPSLYLTLYVYGQLPTVFAAALSFLDAYFFYNYLLDGSPKNLCYTIFLSILVVSSHHFTFVFFLPIVLILTLLMVLKKRKETRSVFRRLLIAFVTSAFLIIVVMEPFFEFVIETPFQAEIPHATRLNIFADHSHSLLFFWGIYGFTAALIPVGYLIIRKRSELLPLFVVFISLFVMGLGGTTPLPRLLLGELWYVLTYDRFAVWASLLFAFLLGIMLKDAGQLVNKYHHQLDIAKKSKANVKILKASLIIGLAVSSIFAMSLDSFITTSPIPDSVLREETVDGGYNSARKLPILVDSGIERLDNIKYFPDSEEFIEEFLNRSAELGIKWVVSADEYYVPFLLGSGYRIDAMWNSNPEIKIWSRDQVTMKELQPEEEFSTYQIVVWSFGPLLTLISLSTLYVGGLIGYHERAK